MALRARDRDRNQVVETLQQAFVDGQIDADELSRRSSAALAAVHLVELERLIGDLQGAQPLAPDLPAEARPRQPRVTDSARPSSRAKVAALVGVSAALALALITPRLLAGDNGSDPSGFAAQTRQEDEAVEHAASMTVRWSAVKDDLSARAYAEGIYSPIKGLGAWRIDADTINAVLAHWEKAFDSPYVRSLSLWPTYLRAERPLGRSRPRVEEWRLESGKRGLELFDEAENGERDLDLFDLHDLDVDALMDNIKQAKSSLNVADAKVSWIDIGFGGSREVPTVEIYLANTFQESGSMETALDGRVIKEWPHTG